MRTSLGGHRRRLLLFLSAIIVPSLVLVTLSLRMISQERELSEKRALDEQKRRVNDIRQELQARLEKIKLVEVRAFAARTSNAQPPNYEASETAFLARLEKNQPVLPWEDDRGPQESQQLLNEPAFAQRIQQGDHEEFARKDFTRASEFYRAAARAAHQPAQVGYAQILVARALVKSGQQSEARELYRKLLSLPGEVIDEQGIPLALYAARQLLDAGTEYDSVNERVRDELKTQRWLSPTESYTLRELINTVAEKAPGANVREAAKETLGVISSRIRDVEQALSLQTDFPNLKVQPAPGSKTAATDSVWATYGEEPWLVSVASDLAGTQQTAIVLRGPPIFASLNSAKANQGNSSGAVQFVASNESRGEALGENFPGLKIVFDESNNSSQSRWNLQRLFYLVAMLLVLTLTSFGGYLLWRDVRREVRLANLRSQFVSSVTHELKTPLTSIRMFAETLRMGRWQTPEAQSEYLDTIVNESERLTRLLNNVLDFSKIEQGQKSYHLEPTSLAEVVYASAKALEYPLAQQGFELHVEVENGLTINADRDAIEQAILNLLTNAMKYSGESHRIGLRLKTSNHHAMIEVTDHGLGIAPEEQTRVFEKFYRVPRPENKSIPGTGLGLTLVEHIAKGHGGSVEVQSAPGEGSTFSIYLPLENSHSGAETQR
jgi:signal transduction histidine kinase